MRKLKYAHQLKEIKKCLYCGKEITLKTHPKTRGKSFKIRKYCSRKCMGNSFSKDRTGIERGPYYKKLKNTNLKYHVKM